MVFRRGTAVANAARLTPRARTGGSRSVSLGSPPASFRRLLERQYRARVRQLMVNERYDELPVRRRSDAAWLYW